MTVRRRILSWGYETVVKPQLFKIGGGNPEAAHHETIAALGRCGGHPAVRGVLRGLVGKPTTPVTVAGISFPGRVGLAAGADKDGVAARAWSSLGFGHIELGTVTAQAQPGNETPRMFRLRDSEAIINRMGFNNAGSAALAKRLAGFGVARGNNALGCPVGISLGKSKVTPLEEAIDDYVASVQVLRPHADYFAINVSSPNTPGLRELQRPEFLADLLAAVVEHGEGIPVFVKFAPDLSDADLSAALDVVHAQGASGLIISNTTIGRGGLAPKDEARMRDQAGGLSGSPLKLLARSMVRKVAAESSLPIIGVGGIMSADDAAAMFEAGAQLVQVYTGFIFRGPSLVVGINSL